MKFSETRLDLLRTGDGLELDIHIWEPDSPKAILLAVHGGLAHAGDYVTSALFFKERGIATAAYDLRGHKQKKVCINTFEQLLDDTDTFLNWGQDHYPDIPVFCLGHSVGALILTHTGLRSVTPPRIKGYIFSSPYYQNAIKVNPLVIPMITLLSRFFPNIPIPGQDITELLTHDKTITRRHHQDERDSLRAVQASVRFASELLAAQEWVKENIQNWTQPLFVVLAGNDQVADTSESDRLFKKIPPNLLTSMLNPENYHENFNEVNREKTFGRIYKWMASFLTV
jgi:alpha-beta hydrolase superfamily lysophospholipase